MAIALLSAAQAAGPHLGKILYSFSGGYSGGPDGAFATGDLIADAAGNYYSTTSGGGGSTNCSLGCGTVYKVANGQESVLHAFTGGSDGAYPAGGLLLDGEDNLYGATGSGGDSGLGTVFKVTPDGTKTTLHSFAGGADDGSGPNGDLVAEGDGNFYGTTSSGGSGNCDGGCGTVYKMTPDGQVSILYAFLGDGGGHGRRWRLFSGRADPDGQGNFYGSTRGGGKLPGCPSGCGTIFKITPDGQKSQVYTFEGGQKGGHPSDRLLLSADGYLYGTAPRGGDTRKGLAVSSRWGWMAPRECFISFKHHEDGLAPTSGLIADAQGNLYGTVALGGANTSGLVYALTRRGKFTVLYDFPGTFNGNFPTGRLLMDRNGNLLGTTSRGGDHDAGIIFEVKN